ncbi:MAG: DedA family protein [Alphaproteobacteria bacterium]|nr:DedA family protein [Alphaproteobacteria bacterium]MBL6937575.1 DedA family protein [Alphaproteobacteria bacterium]MBL7098913.1 DedA family protein [Alphaproteobacteria bacterium]
MDDVVGTTVNFVTRHAEWAFPIMFITAFGESFVFLSLLFPGTTIMLAAGLLVPKGIVPLFPLLSGAILGAVAGDGISYWLGLRFGRHITGRWPFTRYPRMLDASEALFRDYGSMSVFIGRFFGPLRATVPLVAGMMHMPARRFWIANVASALVWAPGLLLPGMVAVLASDELPVASAYRPFAIAAVLLLIVVAAVLIRRTRFMKRISEEIPKE